jgi:hypothetical protein
MLKLYTKENELKFRKKRTDFCYLKTNDFNYNDDYESVMQFINKNTLIPELLEKFNHSKDDQENILKLQKLINKGNLKHKIFENRYCQLYALYLLKEKKISITVFLTVNIYLAALMEFTDLQPLKEIDSDIKEKKELTLIKIADIIDLLNKHLEINTEKFRLIDSYATSISIQDEFKKNELDEIDKNIIKIKKPAKSLEDLVKQTPLIFADDENYYIPLAGLMKTIQNLLINNGSIKIAPVFGTINIHTLYLIHQRGFHPVNLYSTVVKSNPVEEHEARRGPLWIILHDMSHIFFSNFCLPNQYSFFYNYFIPKLSEIFKVTMENLNDDSDLTSVLSNLVDLRFYQFKVDPSRNVDNYLCQILNTDDEFKTCQTLYQDKDEIKKNYSIDFLDLMRNIFIYTPYHYKHNELQTYKRHVKAINFLMNIIKNDQFGAKALEKIDSKKLFELIKQENSAQIGVFLVDMVKQIDNFNQLIFSDKKEKMKGHINSLKTHFENFIKTLKTNFIINTITL